MTAGICSGVTEAGAKRMRRLPEPKQENGRRLTKGERRKRDGQKPENCL